MIRKLWHVFHAVNSGQIRSVALNVPFCRNLSNGPKTSPISPPFLLKFNRNRTSPDAAILHKSNEHGRIGINSNSIQRRTSPSDVTCFPHIQSSLWLADFFNTLLQLIHVSRKHAFAAISAKRIGRWMLALPFLV